VLCPRQQLSQLLSQAGLSSAGFLGLLVQAREQCSLCRALTLKLGNALTQGFQFAR